MFLVEMVSLVKSAFSVARVSFVKNLSLRKTGQHDDTSRLVTELFGKASVTRDTAVANNMN